MEEGFLNGASDRSAALRASQPTQLAAPGQEGPWKEDRRVGQKWLCPAAPAMFGACREARERERARAGELEWVLTLLQLEAASSCTPCVWFSLGRAEQRPSVADGKNSPPGGYRWKQENALQCSKTFPL